MDLTAIRTALAGKKTYFIAIVIIAIGVCEGLLGIDIPGVDVGHDWLGWTLSGLGLGTLRSGIAKAGG